MSLFLLNPTRYLPLVVLPLAAYGCEGFAILEKIDVCERKMGSELDLNVRTEGRQIFGSRQGIVSWTNANAVAAFLSKPSGLAGDAETEAGTELRLAIVNPSGEVQSTCESPERGEYVLASGSLLGTGGILGLPALGAPARDTEVGLAVFTLATGLGAENRPYGILLGSNACPFGSASASLFALEESTVPGSVERPPEVVTLGNGSFVVVWLSFTGQLLESQIRAKVIKGQLGVPVLSLPTVLEPDAGKAVTIGVFDDMPVGVATAALGDDRWAMVWYDVASNHLGVRMAVFNDRFEMLHAPSVLASLSSRETPTFWPEQQSLAIAFDGEVGMAVWSQWLEQEDGIRVFGHFFDRNGDPLTTRYDTSTGGFPLAVHPAASETDVNVVAMQGGGFLCMWASNGSSQDDSAQRDIRAAAFNRDGNRAFVNQACRETDFTVNAASSGDQYRPVATWTSKGTLPIAFDQDGAAGARDGSGLRVVSTSSHALLAEK